MQQRLRKYRRDPRHTEALGNRQITDRSLEIISNLSYYRFLPTSLLVALIEGYPRITHRHLQMLFHRGLINRFTFPRIGNPGEFIYYLDNTQALELLIERGWSERDGLPFEEVRNNKEKDYSAIHDPARVDELQGRLLFLKHELMISRFHAILELACKKSDGKAELTDWRQGSELWQTVEVPKLCYERPREGQAEGRWFDSEDTESLPHRPDAFFTLKRGDEELHFFYEADRKHTSTKKHNRKLRAHFYYIVKQRQHQEHYGVSRIRAVLIETISASWAEELRQAANHFTVSGPKPSPLFWFTTSELFTRPVEISEGKRSRQMPLHFTRPEIIFDRIWAAPVDDTLYSLFD
jgi:Replication-relaxation